LDSKEIQNEIHNARERLAKNLGELDYAFSAQGLWAKTKLAISKFYKDDSGQLRIDRIAISAFVALVYFLISKKD
jgi:hypothetical protein